MKTKFIENELAYDGTQLRSLYAYLGHGVLGDSIVAWVGPCNIEFEHMVDGEDLLQKAKICGDRMLHFIIEIFQSNLFSGVALQRLLASQIKDHLQNSATGLVGKGLMTRDGDDLYFDGKKLSISIATQSPTSTLVHFAVNITNEGTPVKTLSLEDLQVNHKEFALQVMTRFANEYQDMVLATQKVKWVP